MGVKKIFLTLVTIVACVVFGAFVLNNLMPNAIKSIVNAGEDMIWKATGMSFDFNGDGVLGGNRNTYNGENATTNDDISGGVEGFEAAAG